MGQLNRNGWVSNSETPGSLEPERSTYVDESWSDPKQTEIDSEITGALDSAGWASKLALYFIAFCWKSEGVSYVDLWQFKSNPVDDISGPLADMKVFQSGKLVINMGVASGNTLAILGLKELHRRACSLIEDYLRQRPQIPPSLYK